MCTWAHCPWRSEVSSVLELELQRVVRLPDMVLGTELISSGRAASALSHWGFSGQFCLIFEKGSLAYLIIWENIIHYLHTLDGKPQGSSCLPHSLKVIGMCPHTWLLCECWGSELKSSCLYTDRVTCGPGRPATWYATRNAFVLLIFLLLPTPPILGLQMHATTPSFVQFLMLT